MPLSSQGKHKWSQEAQWYFFLSLSHPQKKLAIALFM